MLRMALGLEETHETTHREWDRETKKTVDAIESFILQAGTFAKQFPNQAPRYRKYAVRAEGILRSLDELEESLYAARLYAGRITHYRMDELTESERRDYYRHVYFDKNAYIRLFSLLDKLGTLLDELLELQTASRMKSQFSYFTVLRNMRVHGLMPALSPALDVLKERYQDTMTKLRKRRNTEIHMMNAELQDDLDAVGSSESNRGTLENISANLADAENGWRMVRDSLRTCFLYASGHIVKLGRDVRSQGEWTRKGNRKKVR